ncbi:MULTISPECIES: LysR family transcriptional regulator [unclassified Aliivibrio]|uniref:LysR family transcriptional regulator n=1 Tax=unclassified Aliivibrio TaxID=2645654 RepID=UPI00080E0E17|nr:MULTISPECIES: LysR family transcriptional regulator [unclassified Aliivibrio]OCH18902.1 LysR family transcriptional regulator [Aliivibrio sp. 1S165]OCH19768.1 LysR family transcriptional regulator [Aliivibrio sp. 1S128]OCH30904.1 LysR family transcriptional regulator [Aliivibrio sp. 1S175]
MTPYPNLPYSHNGLKAFESVARLMSFTSAANELNVTQSAVSRQVKQLEDDLNASLIIRKHRAIELTLQGLDLYHALQGNYSTLESIISSWQEPKQKRIVIKATLSFATRILIPKVRELNERYPDYEIVIIPSLEEDECLNNPDYDLLIFHSRLKDYYDNRPNMFLLREEFMAPVCAASIVTEHTNVDSILTMPRLHPTLDHHDWKMWLADMASSPYQQIRNTSFLSLDLALSACLSGQGATVTDLLLILQELDRGFFYCPENAKIQHSAWTYFGHQRTHSAVIDDLIEWLKVSSENEINLLKKLAKKYHWHGVI